MVNTPLASLVVHIEVLQVVVEVDTTSTQVPTKEGSVSGEDSGNVNVPLPAQGDSETGLPFVEVGNNGGVGLSASELR